MKRYVDILFKGVLMALLLAFFAGFSAQNSWAKSAKKRTQTALQKPSKATIWQKRAHDVGRLILPISNYGVFGQHLERIGSGGEWPAGSHEYYIFGAGLWVGGIVDSTEDGKPIPYVTVGYDPNSAGFEFVPGFPPNNYPNFTGTSEDEKEHIYMSTDPSDLADWPSGVKILSEQDSWCYYNDLSPEQHADTKPLGIEVIQHGYAWSGEGLRDIVFLKFSVVNIREDKKTIKDVYIAPCLDSDIGGATDDMVGFDVDRNMAYQYNAVPFESGWTRHPGVLGVDFLESPKADRPIDFNHDGVINHDSVEFKAGKKTVWLKDKFPGEQIGLAAFKKFTIQIDPGEDFERYLMMRGYDYRDTTWYPFDSDEAPEDKRFILTTGPIDLAWHDTASTVIAVMVGWDPSEDLDANLEALGKIDNFAQTVYDAGFVAPSAPPPPHLKVVEGDKKVTLIWDNYPETVPDPFYPIIKAKDPNTKYIADDFEGYRIYRSPTGISGSWELIAEYDKPGDAKSVTVVDSSTFTSKEYHIGNNTGLRYFYVDSSLTNGLDYYYAVTAYDFQPHSSPVTLESSKANKTVARPRTEPCAVSDPSFQIEHTTGLASYNVPGGPTVTVKILERLAITGHDYIIYFTRDENNNLLWNLKDQTTGEVLLEDQSDLAGLSWSKIVDGMTFKVVNVPNQVKYEMTAGVDTFHMSPKSFEANANFRMANWNADYGFYEIRFVGWVDANGDSVYGWEHPHGKAACPFELWSLGTTPDDPSDDVRLWPVWVDYIRRNGKWDPNELATYIPYYGEKGNKYSEDWTSNPRHLDTKYFRPPRGPRETSPQYDLDYKFSFDDDSVHWTKGETWRITALKGFDEEDTLLIKTSAVQAVNKLSELDKIKVVPNPFIISNVWMPSSDYGVIYFTHLPRVCTIRIFTMAGDFVQELKKGYDEMAYLKDEGEIKWDMTSYNHQDIASGVYLAHIDAPGIGQRIIKFAVVK